jgi:chitinase
MVPHTLLLAVLIATAPVESVYPAWVAGVPYKINDLVGYVGITYACIQAHTSRQGLEPPAAPDYWRVYSGPEKAAPSVPQGLATVADGPNRIVVSWNPVQGAASYDLQTDGSIVGGAASPYFHKGLAAASTHTYRVRAVNDGGTSSWSEPVQCATERAVSGK